MRHRPMPDVWSVGHPITDTYLTIAFTKMAISRMFLPPPAFFSADAHVGEQVVFKTLGLEVLPRSRTNHRISILVSKIFSSLSVESSRPSGLDYISTTLSDEGLKTGLGLKTIFIRSWSWPRRSWS